MATIIEILVKICVALTPVFVKKLWEWLTGSSRARPQSVSGKWTGHFLQETGPMRLRGTDRLDVDFNVKQKKVRGLMLLHSGEIFSLNVQGALEYDSYLRLNYDNRNRDMKHFGCLVFKLSPRGDELEGRYLGFGVQAQAIVSGKIYLKKMADGTHR